MPSMPPFAGTSVPAEGVSHWLREFLKSPTLETGLSQLLSWFEGMSGGGIPQALWVWPEPRIEASGVVGRNGIFAMQRRLLNEQPPSLEDLIRWSSAESPDVPLDAIWLQRDSPGSSAIGAVVLDRDCSHGFSGEEQLWLTTLIEWLLNKETDLRDAKLASLAEFAAGAGHEINNPLGTILGRSQLLQRAEDNPERRRALQGIGGQALRIRDMISDMMVYARPPVPRRRSVEVHPLIESVLSGFQEEFQASKIRLDRKLIHISALLDPDQLKVVLIELLRNAVRAVDSGGCIGIRNRLRDWRGSRWLEIDLYNNGPELTPAERTHAFDPFFSGRDAGRGLGFGLTKCWRILELHQGRIGVYSSSDYTVFRTLWPIH